MEQQEPDTAANCSCKPAKRSLLPRGSNRVVLFELKRSEPFPLKPREDIRMVPITSLKDLRRYWSDWLSKRLTFRKKVAWIVKILFGVRDLFFAVEDGKCVHYTSFGAAKHGVFRKALPSEARAIGPSATDPNRRGPSIRPYSFRWLVNYLITEKGINHFYVMTRVTNKTNRMALRLGGCKAVGVCECSWVLSARLFGNVEIKPMSSLED